MGNWVVLLISANLPKFSAAASEQGTEIIGIYQNPAFPCQFNHLLWCGGAEELLAKIRVAIHLVAQMVQRIKGMVW